MTIPYDFSDPGWDETRDYDTSDFKDKPIEVKTNWDAEIAELEAFCLTPIAKASAARRFIEPELEVIKANNGNPTYKQYLNRAMGVMKTAKEGGKHV